MPQPRRRAPSLAVYDKDGKAKVKCFAGCDDELDILPALGMRVADLYDEPKGNGEKSSFNPERLARYEARKTMTAPQRVLDDLLHMPDFGERICKTVARRRPERYLWEKRDLWSVTLTETESAQLAQLAQHASDRLGGVGSDA